MNPYPRPIFSPVCSRHLLRIGAGLLLGANLTFAQANFSPSLPNLSSAADQSISFDALPNVHAGRFDERLIGYWEHRADKATISLEILSDSQLLVSGKSLRFEINPGILRVFDNENGAVEYPYVLQNGKLILTLIDDGGKSYDLMFCRVELSDSRLRH